MTLPKTAEPALTAVQLSQLCPTRRDEHPQDLLWRREGVLLLSCVGEGHWHDKKHLPTLHDLPLITLKTLVTSGGDCSPPLFYADQSLVITPKTHLVPLGGPQHNTLPLHKWAIVFSH